MVFIFSWANAETSTELSYPRDQQLELFSFLASRFSSTVSFPNTSMDRMFTENKQKIECANITYDFQASATNIFVNLTKVASDIFLVFFRNGALIGKILVSKNEFNNTFSILLANRKISMFYLNQKLHFE